MFTAQSRLDMRRASLLLVDDNSHSLEVLVQILVGFRVKNIDTATSSAEALGLAEVKRFDLIITDAEMPEEDGLQFTRKIRTNARLPNFTTPVILVTVHTNLDRVVGARDAGANVVVRKPIAPAVLLSRIEWLARGTRDFVRSDDYCGPDRRFRNEAPPADVGERRASELALSAHGDRVMSQDDIDALFN